MKRFNIDRLKHRPVVIVIVLVLTFVMLGLFVFSTNIVGRVLAQQNCQTALTNPRVLNGLVSTPSLPTGSSIFYNNINTCVINTPQAGFVPFKIPSYSELKSNYYDKITPGSRDISKPDPILGGSTDLTEVTVTKDTLVYVSQTSTQPGDLLIDSNFNQNIPDTGSVLVFVDGDMNVTRNITPGGTATTGMLFVVRGDLNIDKAVTLLNAVFIVSGHICTGLQNGVCVARTSPLDTPQMVINGGLVSINQNSGQNITFSRWITSCNPAVNPLCNPADTLPPAEVIKQVPKFMVVMNNLFSQTLTITTEDTNYSGGLDAVFSPFTYTIDPHSAMSIPQAGYATTLISARTTSGTANGSVHLTVVVLDPATGLPAQGVTVSPSTTLCNLVAGPCSVSVTISISSTTPVKAYNAQISGDGVPAPGSVVFSLTVAPKVTFSASPLSVNAGSNVTATWSGSTTALSTDRLQLFNDDANILTTLPGNVYTAASGLCPSGAPGSALQNGTCNFAVPTNIQSANYKLFLTSLDGSVVKAMSNSFFVPAASKIFTDVAGAARGSQVLVHWQNIQGGTENNSIKLYSLGAPGPAWIIKAYPIPGTNSCSSTPPAVNLPDGQCNFTLPSNLPSGPYVFTMVNDDNNYGSVNNVSQNFTISSP